MIRVGFYVSKEQVEEMVEEVEELSEGEIWEPEFKFRKEDAEQIVDRLDRQLQSVEE